MMLHLKIVQISKSIMSVVDTNVLSNAKSSELKNRKFDWNRTYIFLLANPLLEHKILPQLIVHSSRQLKVTCKTRVSNITKDNLFKKLYPIFYFSLFRTFCVFFPAVIFCTLLEFQHQWTTNQITFILWWWVHLAEQNNIFYVNIDENIKTWKRIFIKFLGNFFSLYEL